MLITKPRDKRCSTRHAENFKAVSNSGPHKLRDSGPKPITVETNSLREMEPSRTLKAWQG